MRNSLILGKLSTGRGLEIVPRDIPEYVRLPQPGAPSGRKPAAIDFGSGQGIWGLTTVFRQPRESSIASELLGIISAFEASKGKEHY